MWSQISQSVTYWAVTATNKMNVVSYGRGGREEENECEGSLAPSSPMWICKSIRWLFLLYATHLCLQLCRKAPWVKFKPINKVVLQTNTSRKMSRNEVSNYWFSWFLKIVLLEACILWSTELHFCHGECIVRQSRQFALTVVAGRQDSQVKNVE